MSVPMPALRLLAAAALAAVSLSAWSDEAAIRKALAERYPAWPPIDEVSKTTIPGLYEVRLGTELVYSDEQGNHVILPGLNSGDGHIVDTRTKLDVTQARIDKLLTVDVPALPFKDAIAFKQGNGSRRLVVFEDPNCHFCRDVEKSLVALKDVTVYTFLIPILGPDSVMKSRDIWCAKDNAKTWRSWMLAGVAPTREMGSRCDFTALDRNRALADHYHVNGTPAIIFEDGSRFAGAADLARLSKRLDEVAAATPAAKKG